MLKKCHYSELFWSAFFCIPTEYKEILRIFPYLVRMSENAEQNNSKYSHFLRSVYNLKQFEMLEKGIGYMN